MRYQVPQFVDIEDKIIGPFTLKQFLMYVAAVMVLVPVYLASDLSLFITIALPVFAIAAAFAHVKIANRSLATTVYNFFTFVSGGQMWIWRRTAKPKKLIIKDKDWQATQDASAGSKLTPLAFKAQALETEGNTVKAEETEDIFDTAKKWLCQKGSVIPRPCEGSGRCHPESNEGSIYPLVSSIFIWPTRCKRWLRDVTGLYRL